VQDFIFIGRMIITVEMFSLSFGYDFNLKKEVAKPE
jgi:hypothetical protein